MSTNSSATSPAIAISATADVPFDLPITAFDPYNNIATDYAGKIHFTSSDPSAQLPADYTFTPADKGAHTFRVVLKTKGQQTLTMTDVLSGSLNCAWVVTVL